MVKVQQKKTKLLEENLFGPTIKFFSITFSVILGLIAIIFIIIQSHYWYYTATNPPKKAADIMIPFANQHNLTKVYEYNGYADGWDNTVPFFTYTYKGGHKLDELQVITTNYLERNGYKIHKQTKEIDSDNMGFLINEGYPYWRIEGSYKNTNIEIVITDHEKEVNKKVISPDTVILQITFTSTSSTF